MSKSLRKEIEESLQAYAGYPEFHNGQQRLLLNTVVLEILALIEDLIGEDEIVPQSETGIDLAPITGVKQRNQLKAALRAKVRDL